MVIIFYHEELEGHEEKRKEGKKDLKFEISDVGNKKPAKVEDAYGTSATHSKYKFLYMIKFDAGVKSVQKRIKHSFLSPYLRAGLGNSTFDASIKFRKRLK